MKLTFASGRSEPRPATFARRTAYVWALALVCAVTSAHARQELRIRADTELVNIGVVASASAVEISGALRDDAGHGVPDAPIALEVAPEGSDKPAPCRPGDSVDSDGDGVRVRTDTLGFFCVRLPPAFAPEGKMLRYAGDRFHSASSVRVPSETGKKRIALEFESTQLVASLDSPSFVVWVTTRDVTGGGAGEPIRLVLSQKSPLDAATETELGVTDVPIGGRARFDIDTRALGGPGSGKLVVRFAGTTELAPVVETALLLRRATVHLSLAAAPRPADPADGVELTVGVSSALGAVGEGWVEAIAYGGSVGMAKVSSGAARVIATFNAPRGKPAHVMLRYIPASEGFVAESPLAVEVPLRAPSPWTGTPWLLGVAAIAYWVVRAWLRPSRREIARGHRADAPAGRAAVEQLSTDQSRSGHRGHVVDAHDGFAITGARVSIVVPVFDGEGVAATQTTGPDGAFFLPHVEAARNDGARLVVAAPHHTTLSEPVPTDGTLAICLVSRRRNLLDRLVAWARAGGRPWGRGKEPTPLELAEAARRHAQPDVEGWAAAVAEAAYGAVSPDERRESEILAREPPLERPSDER